MKKLAMHQVEDSGERTQRELEEQESAVRGPTPGKGPHPGKEKRIWGWGHCSWSPSERGSKERSTEGYLEGFGPPAWQEFQGQEETIRAGGGPMKEHNSHLAVILSCHLTVSPPVKCAGILSLSDLDLVRPVYGKALNSSH